MTQDKRVIKQETLEALRKTIIEIFAGSEYHEAGIREICKRAKVSPQTIYKYFGNKEMLLLSCMEGDLHRLYQHVLIGVNAQEKTIAKLKIFGVMSADFYSQEPAVARIVFQNIPNIYWVKKRSVSLEKYQNLLLALLNKAQQEGDISTQQSINLSFDVYSGAFNRMMLRWVSEDFSSDIVSQAKQLAEILSKTASQ